MTEKIKFSKFTKLSLCAICLSLALALFSNAFAALRLPANVTAKAQSSNSILLTWSPVSGASFYEILRSTARDGKYSKVGETKATKFIDSKLASGRTYYYYVRACSLKEGNANSVKVYAKTSAGAANESVAKELGLLSIKTSGATDFSLKDTKGNTIKLSDYRGKTVILNFWATWCGPCLDEMPELQKVDDEYSDLVIIAACLDYDLSKSEIESVYKSLNLKMPVIPGDALYDTYEKATGQSFGGIPTNIFIDKWGTIRLIRVGGLDEGSVKTELAKISKLG